MSRQLPDHFKDLDAEVRGIEVLPAAEIRARGRRRSRRQMTAMVAAGAAVVATAGVTAAWPRDHPVPAGDPVAAQPTTVPGVPCDLSLPKSPSDVRIRVLIGGARGGLTVVATGDLRARGFTVIDGPAGPATALAATLRYGPSTIGAAALVRAEIHGEVSMGFDPTRTDETLDLSLGTAYTRLATPTEINQNLVTAGEPSAPPECSSLASPR
ncbi:LytR C-terminal domain-containing protein [Actinoplanes sp. NPDC049596]|uniref:LytR C-terminal domain-containing protein n=1 Tax=unclassified Actinoplanes TaxID=2626549 RepID=UPI003431A64C